MTTHNTREERGELESKWIPFISDSMQRDAVYDLIREVDKLSKSLHHQLQKARQDWLQEEIVKLEGMINKDLPSSLRDAVGFCKGRGRNEALQTIIDRYHSELDQDKK